MRLVAEFLLSEPSSRSSTVHDDIESVLKMKVYDSLFGKARAELLAKAADCISAYDGSRFSCYDRWKQSRLRIAWTS